MFSPHLIDRYQMDKGHSVADAHIIPPSFGVMLTVLLH